MTERPDSEIDAIRTFIRKDLRWQADFISKIPLLPRQLAIYIDSDCDHDCIFCRNRQRESRTTPNVALGKYREILEQNLELKFKDISIAANEALSFPKIVELVGICANSGFENIEIITSGTRLADAGFMRELLDAGANSFAIPLYAPIPDVHDDITRTPGSFAAAVKALENLKTSGRAKIYIHTLVLNRNIEFISGLSSYTDTIFNVRLAALPARLKRHIMREPDFKALLPSFEEIANRVFDTLLVGFPRCVADRNRTRHKDDASAVPKAMVFYILGQRYVYLDICADCTARKICMGVVAGYPAVHGALGLVPFSGSVHG